MVSGAAWKWAMGRRKEGKRLKHRGATSEIASSKKVMTTRFVLVSLSFAFVALGATISDHAPTTAILSASSIPVCAMSE